ncbi:MAG: hypothetical protein GWP04_05050 [Gammaproteobacteria bacterium]|nr:hypothetical protein [Gammaproteobacteria bacterium]
MAAARGGIDDGEDLFEQVRRIADNETGRQLTTQIVQGGSAMIGLMSGRLAEAAAGFLKTFVSDPVQNLEYLARGALEPRFRRRLSRQPGS